MTEIYLDHAASTPVRPEVAVLMLQTMQDYPANPSSVHRAGQRARRALEAAREQAARALGASPRQIIFNSGATEGINQALPGLLNRAGAGRLLVSPLEHKAVLAVADELGRQGRTVGYLEPEDGAITPESMRKADLQPGDVVAIMQVNNETGVLADIRHLSNMAHRQGALLFCDATQAFGVEAVDVHELHCDALVISGHKFGGPRGAGILWVREGLEPAPLLYGGSQELGFRAGTSDLPAIAGLSLAMELAELERDTFRAQLASLQALFESGVTQLEGVSISGARQPRSVKHSSVSVEGVDGEALLMALDSRGVQVSVGSACSAGSLEASHVLLAMGLDEERAKATMRFSYGRSTTEAQVQGAAERLRSAISQCRSIGDLVT